MAIIGDEAAAARADAGVVPLSGFVQFDEPNLATGGKAFLPDGEVSRFKKIGDLDPAVLWITNLGSADEPLRRRRNFRCSAFLGPSAQEIARDLGLEVHPDGRLSDGAAAHVAGVLDRALRAAASAYGQGSAYRWVHGLKGDYLYQDIGKDLPRGPLSAVEIFPRQRDVLTSAYQARAIPQWGDWPLGPGTRFVTLRFNRMAYARQMLQMQFPVGKNWVNVQGTAGVPVLEEMLARPCLVRADAALREGCDDASPVTLAALGFDGGRNARRRGWFSQPELASLSEFMEIRADGFLVDEDGTRPLPSRALLPDALTERAERSLSYAFGLVAHCHWLALATARHVADRDVTQADVWSIWLRAMDRSLMHELALRAHKDGLHVESFGEGSIVLRLQDGDLQRAQRFWELEGFQYPVGGPGQVQ
ncbi:MAG: hypothetical protein E2591_26770 [Achromobacter sp.]|uniref:hypothetical protein n=1 Tax=Achromobacter sp. TaxID=134375 RepID=UPI0012C164BE|nr:hypothetical protein [Achromobacter sp.]MPS81682.1 hypothetical protein [Achromobacter sp.]